MRVLVSMLMVFCLSGVTAYAAEVDSVTFKEIDSQFSGDGLTKLQKDEAWKKYKGKCIEWEAELAYLDEGFFGGLSIGFKHKPSTLTYDVLVSVTDFTLRTHPISTKGPTLFQVVPFVF